jgi:hypothetical protein
MLGRFTGLALVAAWVAVEACDRSRPAPPDAAALAVAPEAATSASASTSVAAPSADDTSSYLPPEIHVDLDTSIRNVIAAAPATLGRTPPPPTVVGEYVLFNADGGPYYRAAVRLARQMIGVLWSGGRYDKHPSRAVPAYIFSTNDAFTRFCLAHSEGNCWLDSGDFDRKNYLMVVLATPGAETTAHEMSHVVIRDDFPRAPEWLNEAIATLYENPVFCSPENATGITNWRYAGLVAALDSPRLHDTTRIDLLFPMDADTFDAKTPDGGVDDAKQMLHYGLARYFAQWMDRRGWLWPFYHRFRDGIATDPKGEKAFAAVVGKTPAEANADWAAYVRSLSHANADHPCPK